MFSLYKKLKHMITNNQDSDIEDQKVIEDTYDTSSITPLLILNSQQLDLLNKSTDNNVNLFKITNVDFIGKVLSCYDGDTIRVSLFLNSSLYKFNCRMNKYDSPEMKPKQSESEELCNIEKSLAIKSKKYLSDLVLNKIVYIHVSNKTDPHGRLLINLYLNIDDLNNNKNSVNDMMIDNHMGHPYIGDKKKPFSTYKTWYGF